MASNSKKIITGTVWTSLSTITTAVVQILRLAILTRFLDSTAFGLVAILNLILGLTNTFADLGFSAAIMHKQGLTRSQFSSLYWIQFSIYGFIYLLVWALSIPLAGFYNEPILDGLIPLIMLDLLFYGIGKLYDTLLLKSLRYKILAIRNIACCLISLVVATLCAYRGWGVYSLIFSTLSQTFTLNIWNFIAGQKYLPISFCYDVKSNYNLMKIGLYQTGSQIMDYLSSKLDILILGKMFGADELGLYSLAKELVLKVYNLTNGILNKVLLPIFAQLQKNIEKSQSYYCKLLESTSLINYFGYMILGVFSYQIVMIIYGEAYNSIAPLLTVFSIWGLFTSVGNPIGNIVVAFGRTDRSFCYTIIRIVVSSITIWYISRWGLLAMAVSQVILAIVMLQLSYNIILKPVINIRWSKWIKSFFPMSAITIVLIMAGYFINVEYVQNRNWLYLLIFSILTSTYLFCAFKTYGNLWEDILIPLKGKLFKR